MQEDWVPMEQRKYSSLEGERTRLRKLPQQRLIRISFHSKESWGRKSLSRHVQTESPPRPRYSGAQGPTVTNLSKTGQPSLSKLQEVLWKPSMEESDQAFHVNSLECAIRPLFGHCSMLETLTSALQQEEPQSLAISSYWFDRRLYQETRDRLCVRREQSRSCPDDEANGDHAGALRYPGQHIQIVASIRVI